MFLVEPGEDVLTAGLRQGIDLRYGCRHGKCTTCKYRVVEGDVVHSGASPYAFSDRELEEGGVLLCSTFACSALVIAPFGEPPASDGFVFIPPEERTARVISMTPGANGLVELRLRSDTPVPYRPGQYVEIALPGTAECRSYSMANPPDPSGDLEFLIDMSHRRVLDALLGAPAEGVTVLGPFGRLFHRPADRPILMAATGAGLAPVLAILRAIRTAGGAPPIRFFYGVLSGGIPHLAELTSMSHENPGFELFPVDLTPNGPLRSRLGPLVRRIGREVPDASGHDAYAAGPLALCDAVESLLTAKGLPERRYFAERFYSVAG